MSKSITVLLAGCAIAALLVAAGCRNAHLGPDTSGAVYKNAILLQAQGDDTVEPPELSADDAKLVMQVHRTGDAKGADSSTQTTSLFTPLTMTSTPSSGAAGAASGTTGLWPGATGNIVLEAK